MARKTTRIKPDILEANLSATEEEFDGENPTVAEIDDAGYNKTRGLRSIFPARIRMNGSVTGKPYEWMQPGDIVLVDDLDVDDLLSHEVGGLGGCCGSSSGRNRLFELTD